jgi:uncharacterized protein YndB with AHSA1/START domain
MAAAPLIIERIFNAPLTRVWRALTESEDMKHWYFDIPDFKPEPGFVFSFPGNIDGKDFIHRCKITEVVLLKKIAYTMAFDINSIQTDLVVETQVSFELEPEGDKTKLTLIHEGLENFPEGLKHFAFDDFVKGWGLQFDEKLKGFLEIEN